MQAKLDHVVLWVANPLRSLEFYEKVVGLTPIRADEFRESKAPFPSVRVSSDSIIDLMAKSPRRSSITWWRCPEPRVLLRFTSDAALVQRTPVFYGKTFNRGKLTSTIPVPGRAEIVLTGWPDPGPPVARAWSNEA